VIIETGMSSGFSKHVDRVAWSCSKTCCVQFIQLDLCS
jgi:hypothetical protein